MDYSKFSRASVSAQAAFWRVSLLLTVIAATVKLKPCRPHVFLDTAKRGSIPRANRQDNLIIQTFQVTSRLKLEAIRQKQKNEEDRFLNNAVYRQDLTNHFRLTLEE